MQQGEGGRQGERDKWAKTRKERVCFSSVFMERNYELRNYLGTAMLFIYVTVVDAYLLGPTSKWQLGLVSIERSRSWWR